MVRSGCSSWRGSAFGFVLLAAMWLAQAADAQEPSYRVMVGKQEARFPLFAAASFATPLVDYGGSVLFAVDMARGGDAAATDPFADRSADLDDRIWLNGRVLDGADPQQLLSTLTPAERFEQHAPPDPSAGLYLIQFVGPLHEAWEDLFVALGGGFRQAIPSHAFIVSVDPARAVNLPVVAALPFVRYVGGFEPGFRLEAELREGALSGDSVPRAVVVVLTYDGIERAARAVESLRDVGTNFVQAWSVGECVHVELDLSPRDALKLAARPDVLAIEPRGVRRLLDERQGRTMSGHVGPTGPLSPGYLAWLASKGFGAGQFGGFSVNVVDDARTIQGHPDLPTARVAFEFNPSGQGASNAGHGFLNAHIIAGFNSGTGAAFEDSGGFNYGLGIAPWAQVGATAIFGPGGGNATDWEDAAYRVDSRISNNSWGYVNASGGPVAKYDSSAREFDVLVRDVRGDTTGNHELVVVFAAGNDGSGPNTVGAPATAKNIICVGASENWRSTGTDGCGITNSGADDIDDIIAFSSRGPVNLAGGDGRAKPDLMAPGTHIQAGVPQTNYVGGGTCDNYWPAGQTLYSWSSGTSHAAPAVAGAAALLRQRFLNQGLAAPSPAMTKAWLVNAATYLTGVGAGGTLPSPSQGMGRVDLGRAFDDVARLSVDQSVKFGATGASHVLNGSVADPSKPVRVTLVWTDAPGGLTGAPWVNNLDLTVQATGATYRGNVFSGATSISGGTADPKNNSESVFLPAGTTGPITVTVLGAGISGDGVPGDVDKSDQDFALVVYNVVANAPPIAAFGADITAGPAPLVVTFANATSGNVTGYLWDFGDGTQSSLQHPVKSYAQPGGYTVTLTATGPFGSHVATSTIDVRPRLLYMSFTDPVTLPGAGLVDDEDIVVYDSAAGTWSVHFDGGDVGLAGADVRGFALLPGGDILLTFSGASVNVPGLVGGPSGVAVTNRQAVRFAPTSLGSTTAGAFSFYFDGEDVGLTTSGEALDAFQVGSNGTIYISTSGNPTVSGVSGAADEDVLIFTPSLLGATTAGTWLLHFDGSDVGIGDASTEDIDAVALDPQGRLYFSTSAGFMAPGASGADEDIVRFTGAFGPSTTGILSLIFDLSMLGVASGADVDGLSFAP